MSSRLAALTARRVALQAECAVQRDEAAMAYGQIEQGVARVDRVVGTVRRFTPVLVAAGAVGLLVVGPSRLLSLLRRGIALSLYAREARRLLG
jgi:YqjK-like protein